MALGRLQAGIDANRLPQIRFRPALRDAKPGLAAQICRAEFTIATLPRSNLVLLEALLPGRNGKPELGGGGAKLSWKVVEQLKANPGPLAVHHAEAHLRRFVQRQW